MRWEWGSEKAEFCEKNWGYRKSGKHLDISIVLKN